MSTSPLSTSCMIATVANIFDTEPMPNIVVWLGALRASTSASPKLWAHTTRSAVTSAMAREVVLPWRRTSCAAVWPSWMAAE